MLDHLAPYLLSDRACSNLFSVLFFQPSSLELLPCSLNQHLPGSLVDEDQPRQSLASIYNPAANTTATSRSGDGQGHFIERAAMPIAQEATDKAVRRLSENQFEMTREGLESTLAKLDRRMTDCRIVPAFREGHAIGVKLFSIRPGTFFASLGLQNGDLIQRVNGFDLKDPEGALSAYASLTAARHFEVDIERGGAAVRKTLDIRGSD